MGIQSQAELSSSRIFRLESLSLTFHLQLSAASPEHQEETIVSLKKTSRSSTCLDDSFTA